jgi:hypothetical protein
MIPCFDWTIIGQRMWFGTDRSLLIPGVDGNCRSHPRMMQFCVMPITFQTIANPIDLPHVKLPEPSVFQTATQNEDRSSAMREKSV